MSNIAKHRFTITYESSVDLDTGEILETKIVSKTSQKIKEEKVTDTEPKVYLEDNKYKLSPAAAELMGVSSDDKLDIKYEEANGRTRPIIGSDEAFGTHGGNRLTKSLTVAFRGNKNLELSKFGSEFKVIPHPTKEGLFILDSGNVVEPLKGDENIQVEEADLNLEGLIDDTDVQVSEIDSNFFQL